MNLPNYPFGVSSKDFDSEKPYTHSFELELSDLTDQDEYPYSSGCKELVIDVTVTDLGVEIENGTYFHIDQDGGTYKESKYEPGDGILDSLIREKASEYDLNHANKRNYKEN